MSTPSRKDVSTSGATPPLVRPKWHYLYFLLAAFDVLTVCAGLYLNYRLMGIYTQSLETNHVWADRATTYSHLGELAAVVNAPGNDVFDTRQVDAEEAKMRAALQVFDGYMASQRGLLEDSVAPALAAPLLSHFDDIAAAMKQMIDEAERIFSYFRAQRPDLAGERMATMDQRFASLNTTLARLRFEVGSIQKRNFDRQSAAAEDLRKFEYAIGALILFMVAGATLYGHRISRQMQADAEEKRRHFEVLGEAEARTHSILDTAAEGIIAFDQIGRIETFNKASERLFGYADGEAIGKDIKAIVPFLWESAHFNHAAASGNASTNAAGVQAAETMGQRRDGTAFPIELSVSDVRVGGKTIFTGIVRDISDRLQAEEALRIAAATEAANTVLQRDEQRLRLLKGIGEQSGAAESVEAVLRCGLAAVCGFAGWPVGHAWVPAVDDRGLLSSSLWFLDDDAKYARFRSSSEATPCTADAGDMVRSVFDSRQPAWIADVEQAPLRRRRQAMIDAGLHAACAFPILFDREVEAVLEFFSPETAMPDADFLEFLDQVGSLLGAVVRRKRDAAELQKLAMIAQNTDQAVIIANVSRVIEWVNPGFTTMTGYTLEESVGRKPGDLLQGKETDPNEIGRIRSALDAGQKVDAEIVNYTKSGRKFWLRMSIQPIFDRTGKFDKFIAIEHDVTERKVAEENLRDKEEEIRSVVGNLVDGVISIDARGSMRSFNSSAERLFGYSAAEVVGRNVSLLMPEPYRSGQDGYLQDYLRSGNASIVGIGREVEGLRKDGRRIPLDLAVNEYRMKGERYFTGILRDITERKRVTEELKRTQLAAEEANRAKSAFLAMMSHEIRTPMNAITGMLELLGMSRLNEEQAKMLAVVSESSRSLLGIVNDVLDISKIEAGHLGIDLQPARIKDIVESIEQVFRDSASRKGLLLHSRMGAAVPAVVRCDAMRVKQILSNLVSNAIKFTDRGEVEIDVDAPQREAGKVQLRIGVRDSGIGIGEADQAKLFQPFVQVEMDASRRFGGSGLGLAICRRLATLMGGELTLESALGKGSTVTLAIPVSVADASDLPSAGDAITAVEARDENVEIGHVLVCDDNALNRNVAVRQLTALGYAADTADDGLEAMRKWETGDYALILLDCQMPNLSGYDVAQRIREWEAKNTERARTIILAYTANVILEDRERCFAAGMDDVVAKPASLQSLRDALGSWMKTGARAGARVTQPSAGRGLADVSEAKAAEGPIDWLRLQEISGGDAQFEREILLGFVAEKKADFQRILALIPGGDLGEVAGLAHRVKGAARTAAATDFGALCEELEALARAGDRPAAIATQGRFAREFDALTGYIERCYGWFPGRPCDSG